MANKNPVLKTGKRKRNNAREDIEPKPDKKPLCPRWMVRYEQPEDSIFGYKTIWICRVCLKFLLREDRVQSHVQQCKVEFINSTTFYEPLKLDESRDTGYICQVCNDVFSRKVTLKKHMEKHESASDSELYESENE